MTNNKQEITSIINRLALSISLLVAVSLPLGYGLLAWHDLSGDLSFKARVKASALDGLIAQAPGQWISAKDRMRELIARAPVLLDDELIEVRDVEGTLVAESGQRLRAPCLVRSYPLLDSGRTVGRIDVSASLTATIAGTTAAGTLGLLLGALVFVVMQVLPLRALRRVTDALVEEMEQSGALLRMVSQRETALRESEENLAITLNSIGDAVIATDTRSRITRMNPAAERLTGWPLAAALGRPLAEVFRIVNADTREAVANPAQRAIELGEVVGLANHTLLLARDGSEHHIADSAAPIRDASGRIVGVVLVFSDVTERNRTNEALHQTQAILQAAMNQSPAGIVIADAPSGAIRYINDAGLAICRQASDAPILGQDLTRYFANLSVHDLDGRPLDPRQVPLARAIIGAEAGSREYSVRKPDGSELIAIARAAPIRNTQGHVVAAVSVFIDVTENRLADEEIKRLAFYDQLTGLPNRRLLLDRLTQALASQNRYRRGGALLFIDLDNFKTINDTLGHDCGDQLLKQVAERLTTGIRGGDTVARIGGDEFVVLLDGLSTVEAEAATQAEVVGEKLLGALNQDFPIAGQTNKSTASIGIALFKPGIGGDELFKRADLAMYQAKSAGRNTLCFFDPQMQAMVRARTTLEADLRAAIRARQFVLAYQPQVDADGSVFGAEALLRWRRNDGTLVLPGEFIALAEETGQILAIGQWVLEAASAQLANWAQQGHGFDRLTLAVNVSARQFHHPDFVAQVRRALAASGANPRRLKLELTESLLVDDIDDVIGKMSALRALGVGFSLDDFGTGYSSLAYLKRLPLDQLKIDRSFIGDLLTDANDAVIVRTIVALGQSLGLAVIAEGVENEEQRDVLAAIGCRCYQGYHFGRPMPVGQLEQRVGAAAKRIRSANADTPVPVG